MASTLVDLVKISSASTGTGAISLGPAVQGYRGIEALTNGEVYSYSIQDGSAWEFGRGTFLSDSSQFIRTPIDSSDGGAAINIKANSQISFVALSEDLDAVQLSNNALAAASQTQVDAAQVAQDREVVEAAAANVTSGEPAYPNAYATTLPLGVTYLSDDGLGSGTGGTPGTYEGGVSGGPSGFAWTYDIGDDGSIADYRITNRGLSTSSTAPTLSYPSGSITGATVPTASVGSRVGEGDRYWAVSDDGATLDMWTNDGTSTPAAVLDPNGDQIKLYVASGLDGLASLFTASIDASFSPPNYAVPLVIDADGNIPIWLLKGLLDGTGIGPNIRGIIAGDIAGAVDGSIDRSFAPPNYVVPLVIDADGNIPVWLLNGNLDATGIGPQMISVIKSELKVAPEDFALRNSPTTATAPVVTDGRTLWKARGKLATLANGGTALLSIVLTGNSWSEQLPIATGMRTYLERLGYTCAGPGWIYVRPGDGIDDNQWPEVNLSFSAGWSLWDVVDAGPPDTYGCGPDGHALWATGTTATLDLTAEGTDFRIFYRKTLGAFVWSTDGGITWSDPVTGDGSGDLGIVHIEGLGSGQHTLKIALTGNTDTVVLYGFHAIDTTVSGFVINKMGNGGAAGNDYLLWADDYIQPCAAEIGADVIIDNTVANDFRLATSNGVANTPDTCAAAADAVASNWQAACPGAAVITVCPSLLNAAAGSGYEIPAYRDALYKACITYGREFANLCDTWGGWADENANGQYAAGALGNLHPGDIGGYRIGRFLISTFPNPERLSA
ncbi:hypothetical protein GCM10011349_20040 [Novosphingobium indicum]|uniref:SGNH hydrolase-type esterase domain-containing protein n=1 Tax=Novosphingobium indicum TaxID=462949 RepID=A0ABQ2JNK9_9SPHN|nr:hypothetical protein [Novosphingobium indicum]GGN49438.1 hypothetical protein GCM10011349_20040 [Novosphingobium indicum]